MEEETAIEKALPLPSVAMTRKGFEPTTMEEAYRFCTWMAQSDMVPQRYQGNPGGCMIAYDFSLRLGVSYLTVMQHVYNVHGRPSMEAVLAIALTNSSGLFVDPLEYEVVGDDATKKDFKVRAFATRTKTNTVLYGPWITWDLVSGEGWDKKSGSKWLTMADQMFHYRAASWFQRRHCPEVTMGMLSAEEAHEMDTVPHQKTKQVESTAKTTDRIKKKFEEPTGLPPVQEPEQKPPATTEPPAAEKPKRKRRTKAEIEADKKAEEQREADAKAAEEAAWGKEKAEDEKSTGSKTAKDQANASGTEAPEPEVPEPYPTEPPDEDPEFQCERCKRIFHEEFEKCPACMGAMKEF